MKFKDYILEIQNFYRDNGIEIDPVPNVKVDTNEVDVFNPLIKTGHYNPQTKTIVLNVGNRHLKDILRSFCHELVHHHQNISDNKFKDLNMSGKLVENKDLETIEGEAYRIGNLMFRKWTETKSS